MRLAATLGCLKDVDGVPGTNALSLGGSGQYYRALEIKYPVNAGLSALVGDNLPFLNRTTPANPPSSKSQRYTDEMPPS